MRTTRDRIRHASCSRSSASAHHPARIVLFGLHASDMGVIGIGSAVTATVWNYVYNLGFDRTMQRWAGHTRKSLLLRVAHSVLFEAGLLVILLPAIAWYLGISLAQPSSWISPSRPSTWPTPSSSIWPTTGLPLAGWGEVAAAPVR